MYNSTLRFISEKLENKDTELETTSDVGSSASMGNEKDDKKDVDAGKLIESSSPANSTAVSQDPPIKSETKEDETIHDSDFEEPSGKSIIYGLFSDL